MNNLIDEELDLVATVLKKVPATRTMKPRQAYRWITAGVGGLKLEAIKVGRQLKTSEPALRRFLTALNADPTTHPRAPDERPTASPPSGANEG